MKNNLKWISLAIAFVAIIGIAGFLYNDLSDDYKGGNLSSQEKTENSSKGDAYLQPQTTTEAEKPTEKFKAPDFTVLDYNGNEVKLSDYKGKPVVLNFWATWCFYCTEEMPDFDVAYEKYPEVEFLMVNATDGFQETTDSAKKYYDQKGFDFNIYFDTKLEAVNNYGVTGFPATFFIDADGNLIANASGMLDLETLETGIGMITN